MKLNFYWKYNDMPTDMAINVNAPEISFVLDVTDTYAWSDNGHLMGLFDSETGAPIDPNPIFEDFGDVAPFFLITGREDLAETEFNALYKKLVNNPLHVNPRLRKSWMIGTYDWTDLILGLIEYFHLTKKKEALELADNILNIWAKYFYRKTFACGWAIKFKSLPLSIPVSPLVDVGMFPELLINRAKYASGEERDHIKNMAFSLVREWINDPYYKQFGLFPNFFLDAPKQDIPVGWLLNTAIEKVFPARTKVSRLFKHNTNALASLFAVWKEDRNEEFLTAIEKWVAGCRQHLITENNMVAMMWCPDKGIIQGPTDHNFQVIDLLCDIAEETGDQSYLDLARSIAEAWINVQGSSGLIPHEFGGTKVGQAMSDSQTDFSVALMKLWALTKESRYSTAAEEIMNAVKKYMYRPCGMANWVDVKSGVVIDGNCKTKFLVLSLKGWLALYNREKIYNDKDFTEILSDR